MMLARIPVGPEPVYLVKMQLTRLRKNSWNPGICDRTGGFFTALYSSETASSPLAPTIVSNRRIVILLMPGISLREASSR